jgi:UTP-glucose-1-phosphate uridylyltransferase
MKYKVCILAAGMGSRMMPYTEHINKSLLPVNFKAVISHIIEKFDTDIEFVVAVGHLKETVIDYLDCAHQDRKITIVEVDRFIGKGSGPGYSLMQCRNFLDLPFIFFASDTLVLEDIPPPKENWLGVSSVTETKEYCTAKIVSKKIVSLDDKVVSDNDNAFIGVAGVKNHDIFFEALSNDTELKNDELQVSNGFNALIEFDLKPYYFTWHDTGNLGGYTSVNNKMSKSDCAFDFSKSDEFLYFVDNKVIKYFKDQLVIKNRFRRSKILHGLCPEINCIKDSFYAYEKVGGRVLYDTINDQIVHDFIHWVDENLWKKVEISNSQLKRFKSACFNFYYKKTLLRIDKYQKKHRIKDQPTSINGVKVPSIESMISLIDWDYMSTGIVSNFHGDLQFDNILLKDDGDFLMLDWRQDFSGIVDFGDQYYDLAKLNGGMRVSYKLIKNNKFSFYKDSCGDITIEHDTPSELNRARKIFKDYLISKGLDTTKVDILTGLVYLNMSPMHHEPFDHFIYNLGRLTLYKALLKCEKIHAID